jgi:hypothetical protein
MLTTELRGESPVMDSDRRSRVSDSNRYRPGVGGARPDVFPHLALQGVYSQIFFDSAELTSEASTTPGILMGKYTGAADTPSLGVQYRF